MLRASRCKRTQSPEAAEAPRETPSSHIDTAVSTLCQDLDPCRQTSRLLQLTDGSSKALFGCLGTSLLALDSTRTIFISRRATPRSRGLTYQTVTSGDKYDASRGTLGCDGLWQHPSCPSPARHLWQPVRACPINGGLRHPRSGLVRGASGRDWSSGGDCDLPAASTFARRRACAIWSVPPPTTHVLSRHGHCIEVDCSLGGLCAITRGTEVRELSPHHHRTRCSKELSRVRWQQQPTARRWRSRFCCDLA